MTQQTIYDFNARKNNGEEFDLSAYQEKVLLIVNTASKCGFTLQYAGLEKLYEEFREQGLEILAFPSNQFMNQEPLSDKEIADFCQLNYGVSFPVFKKVDVNGKDAHPLFKYLKKEAPGVLGSQSIKWNFTKFLVGRDGKPVKRYAPATKPKEIKSDIEKYLSTDDDKK
ncbi:MAG: glutathione peroxidase [Bacteroidales bacterium]|nr:glutathione peroxidase [Bacteroidales bacterium]